MARMKVISVNVPEEMVIFIDSLTNVAGIAPSRSELVRMCLTLSLPKLEKMFKKRQAIVANIKTSKNFLTPNDVIFVKNASKTGNGYDKYKIVGKA